MDQGVLVGVALDVALLAEGVDRNRPIGKGISIKRVALLAEGVDRNTCPCCDFEAHGRSPSSRRAWIEIGSPCPSHSRRAVALLAEGVDRNYKVSSGQIDLYKSPSSRRAWIEISSV